MPLKPPRPCASKGCAALVRGARYCPDHAHLARKDKGRRDKKKGQAYDKHRRETPGLMEAEALRSSTKWQRFRVWFLARNSLCCNPGGWHKAPRMAEQVHHIVGLAHGTEAALDPTNCAPLCTRCHARIEANERKGKPTQHLFNAWIKSMKEDQQSGVDGG